MNRDDLQQFLERLAPAELAAQPVRVFIDRELPESVLSPATMGVWTSDARLIDRTTPFGSAGIVLAVGGDIATAVHELAHHLEPRGGFLPETLHDISPEAVKAAAAEFRDLANYHRPESLPWEGHDQNWTRVAAHLYWRAVRFEPAIDGDNVLNLLPAFGPAQPFLESLREEAEAFRDVRFSIINQLEQPSAYSDLWAAATRPYFESLSGAASYAA